MEPKVVNVYDYSLGMPRTKSDEIKRDNLFGVIDRYFENGKVIIFLGNESQSGKKTFLKQFAQFKGNSGLSSFVNPHSPITADLGNIMTDLAGQIYWLVNQEELDSVGYVDVEFFRRLLLELKRLKRKKNDIYYFIIDGLESLTKNKDLMRGIFSNVLPIGEDGYRFLISGTEADFAEFLPKNFKEVIEWLLPPFGLEETKLYFKNPSGSQLSDGTIDEIFLNANRGNPGKLSQIKRVWLEQSMPIQELLEKLDGQFSIHDFDWSKALEANDALLMDILSVVSIDEHQFTIAKLASVLNADETLISIKLQKLTFIEVDQDQIVRFITIGHKHFFRQKLSHNEEKVNSMIVSFLLTPENTDEALMELPYYYRKQRQWESLLAYLSDEYLPQIIQKSQSITVIKNKLDLGHSAAEQTENDGELLRFSMQGSLIQNIEGLHIWNSEIEARIEMDQYDLAIKLAQSALLKEDRLRLLAKIAKQRAKKNLERDEQILDQIKSLYKEVDFKGMNEQAIDIAADLFYSVPELGN
ncbi:MAG: hypothetical protein WDO15_18360 [Bacteroidota bacterium]